MLELRTSWPLALWVWFAALTASTGYAQSTQAASVVERSSLVRQLRDGDYAGLERTLAALHESYENAAIGEDQLESVFFAFANSSRDLEAKLQAWVSTMPASYAARLAQGIYAWNLGMLAGGSRGPGASPEANRDREERFERANVELSAALGIRPDLGVAYGVLMQIATELGDMDGVMRLARAGLAANPRSFIIRRRFLDSLRPWWREDTIDVKEALARTRAFIASFDAELATIPELRVLQGYENFLRGDLLVREGKRHEATRYYNEALRFGEYWAYFYYRGVNHYRMGNYRTANSDFDRALEMRPQASDVLNMKARALQSMGEREAARAAWTLSLELNPLDPVTLLHVAFAQRDAKQFEEAVATLSEALVLGSWNEHIWDARGRIYLYDLQNFEQATADLGRAIELNPDEPKHRFNYAMALYKSNDCEARAAFSTYLDRCKAAACPGGMMDWATHLSERLNGHNQCDATTSKVD